MRYILHQATSVLILAWSMQAVTVLFVTFFPSNAAEKLEVVLHGACSICRKGS